MTALVDKRFQNFIDGVDWNFCLTPSPKHHNLLTPNDILNSNNIWSYQKNDVTTTSSLAPDNAISVNDELEENQLFKEYLSSVEGDSDCEKDTDKSTSNDDIINNQKKEISRKEGVIKHKDEKATKLINIIRAKNKEIMELKCKLATYERHHHLCNLPSRPPCKSVSEFFNQNNKA